MLAKRRPGEVRDAIVAVLSTIPGGASVRDIQTALEGTIGYVAPSSVRSYLRLNTPTIFDRNARGHYRLQQTLPPPAGPSRVQPEHSAVSTQASWSSFSFGHATLYHTDCFDWLRNCPSDSIRAVVTDPPYGLFEYTAEQQRKLRLGRGGVWRIPPSFDGTMRSPLPRFTVLTPDDLEVLESFFFEWCQLLLPTLVPGANVVIASNPLVSFIVSTAIVRAGLERRGEIVRLVMTMRGGDRPKAAHHEFPNVSVMPRSMWEPWLLFRKPLDGTARENLRRWKTGGFRRPSPNRPFGDVIQSSPTHKAERALAPHPSLKPQAFLRAVVRGVLPLGEGTILDPFAGSGSTLAAAEANGYASVGIERDPHFYEMARGSIEKLASYKNGDRDPYACRR